MNDNEWVKIAVSFGLGLLRGITNILPIDGAAHATLLDILVGQGLWPEGNRSFSMSAILQLGSWLAILAYFRKDIRTQLQKRSEQPSQTRKQWAGYGLSIIVTLSMGLLLRQFLPGLFEDFQFTVWLLIGNGALLLIASRWASTHAYGYRSINQLSWSDLVLIGLVHGLGILPGLSRIALLLAIGLWLRLSWFEAVRLTLILSIPTIILSVIYTMIIQPDNVAADLLYLGIGCVSSGLAAWFTLRWIAHTSLHSRERLPVYGLYCIAIGVFAWIVVMLPH